ncbi:MAG: CRISPR-associated endonuclease Cas3'' [Nitrososphaeria archaeon]
MSAWLCSFTDRCPFFQSSFCGHNTNKPLLLSYHPEPDSSTIFECYVEHMINCWNEWQNLAPKWINPVKRILSSVTGVQIDKESFQKAMSLVILHHDVGKLTKEYQEKKFFRHEIISAYILYRQFDEEFREDESNILPAILASAVYLHHEALQISHNYFEMRDPTYSYLLHLLSSRTFNMIEHFNELINQMNQKYITLSPSVTSSLVGKPIMGTDVARTLSSMIVTVDGYSEPLVTRIAVAAVLHPLTICDNLAANKRGGTPSSLSKALISFFNDGAITVRENE